MKTGSRHPHRRSGADLTQFGGLIRTYAGWGMRIKFVPDDSTHEEPITEVREPRKDER